MIKYLEILSNNADAANVLTNGSIVLVLLKMLYHSKVSLLHAQLASIIILLIRHFTYFGDELASSGILGALTNGLRDRQYKVRRFFMVSLSELLFYISTQNEHAQDNKPMESPSKDSRPLSYWQANEQLPVEVDCCKSLIETVELFSTVTETFSEIGIFAAVPLSDMVWADKASKMGFFKIG
ncbi:hypothetical protein H5410_036223 [Solanum commersonii]|uniref:Uncharacterized protein n=1 Tax=Solanum commersonii TaxID=4109 RepID=A0A9J5Y516_SOLCO|nr:hypothetical protein H5410_036223 [Solanum commersonii]